MIDLTLSQEHWFKIYMVLDNLGTQLLDKRFLLFSEYYKNAIKNIMMVYVSTVESLNPYKEYSEFKSKYDVIEDTTEQQSLVKEYEDVIIEYNLQKSEVESILSSKITFNLPLIPSKLVSCLDEDIKEVLVPILGGLDE